MPKDPLCGMDVKDATYTSKKFGTTYSFCSTKCKEKFDKTVKEKKVIPTVLIIGLIIFAILSYQRGFMSLFMGWFFILVSLLKMPDWKEFAQAFKKYDIIAKRFPPYAWTYPAIELLLGVSFLFANIPKATIVTLVILSIGSIGVAQNLLSKNPVRCASLGTLINIPLTTFTLVEDLLMVIMSLMVLL